MQNLEMELADKGLLSEVGAEDTNTQESSWFIILFQAISGMLSSMLILLLMLFSLNGLLDEAIPMIIMGVIFLIFSYILLRNKGNEFLEYFALVFAFAGEISLLFGLGDLLNLEENSIALVLLVAFTILFFIFDSILHRFMSAMAVLYAIHYFAIVYGLEFFYTSALTLFIVWIWLNEYRNVNLLKYKQSLGYASVIVLIYVSNSMLFMELYGLGWGIGLFYDISYDKVHHLGLPTYIYNVVYFLGVGVSLGLILQRIGLRFQDKLLWFIIAGAFLLVYIQPIYLNLFIPIIVLLLAFYGQNILLYILGTVALVLNIFFYYALTLVDFITKSQTLFIFGVVVLGLALALHMYLRKQEKESHA